jgi:hypothetical protein
MTMMDVVDETATMDDDDDNNNNNNNNNNNDARLGQGKRTMRVNDDEAEVR